MTGFDNGTTRSKVSRVDPSGKPVIVPNPRGQPDTPSVVYHGKDGEGLIGTEALEQGCLDPGRCLQCFKLKLGSTESLIPGEHFTATDATEKLIAHLKELAERQVGVEISEAVATCPANFRDDAKQALIEAFERNGIKVLKLVPEPTAAGLSYAAEKSTGQARLAVYDFGGGTFDGSILKVNGPEMKVLATAGVPELGGRDIDACLMKRVLDAFKAEFNIEPTREKDPLLFLELGQTIERAKISLNTRKEVPIVVSHDGHQLVVKISQGEFHADIDPLFQKSLEVLQQAVGEAGLTMDQIDRLIMVGGSSNIRYFQEKLADRTGLVPRVDIDPQKAVAYGAALASVMELERQGRAASLGGKAIPPPSCFVQDATAHDVGCCVADGPGPNQRLSNFVLIPKNTPIPCRKRECFYLQDIDQTELLVEILQGAHDLNRDDCLLIGEIEMNELPKEQNRTPRIQVEFVIDSNGMVTATITDKVGGKQETVTVDYKQGTRPRPKPEAA